MDTPIPIEALVLRAIRLPLVSAFATSFGRETHRRAILTTVYDADGHVGWGECVASAAPGYSAETVATAWPTMQDFLGPALLEAPVAHPSELAERWGHVRGHPMAKAGLESAVWDLYARRQGRSLSAVLGGTPAHVPSGISLGIQPTIDALGAKIETALAEGYRRVKLKIAPGWDRDVLAAVRSAFPDVSLMADANAAYRIDAPDDWATLRALDDHRLLMLEQPFRTDDLLAHARLQRDLATPVCLDESLGSAHLAKQALELASCRILNVKPGRVGGLQEAMRLVALAQAHDADVWCGGMLETGIGRAHNVALASTMPTELPHDLAASARYYDPDLVDPPFALNADGTLSVPTGPGLGVAVDRDRVEEVTSQRAELSAS